MNDTINFQDNFFVQFYLLSNQNFPFKVYTTDCIMPGFWQTVHFQSFVLGVLKVNYSVNIEDYFSYIFSCYFHVP